MNWQPIETAPKDRPIDLWVERRCAKTLSVVEAYRRPDAQWLESFFWKTALRENEDIGPCWVGAPRHPIEKEYGGYAWVAVAWMEIPEGPNPDTPPR
jgi:hypothetical protein